MKILKKIQDLFKIIRQIRQYNVENRLLVGALLARQISEETSINEAEFKVFSQFGDDGIIQCIINNTKVSNTKFVEFGVETYDEANTKFLLMYKNWQGLVIDGSEANVNIIKKDPFFWQYDLTAVSSFITAENINDLLLKNGFSGKIGLLSIDIDGNDYWVWKAITVTEPDIVVVEYNSLFGIDRAITIPYKSDFYRGNEHYSNLYFGASLAALYDLAKAKGYSFIGCNQAGNNAFFIKDNLIDKIKPVSLEEGFVSARFREARNKNGELTYAGIEERKNVISGLPVFNIKTGSIETF
ncbi:hypothetical protein [Spirosoma aerophilum]